MESELIRMSKREVLASQKGMDRRIAGWKLGDLCIYLLYTQIWRYYWFRIETPKGELVKKNDLHKHYFSYERAMAKIADVIEELTGNKEVVEEFREPLRIKQKEDAHNDALLETYEDTEIFKQFTDRFFAKGGLHQGMLVGDNGAVGLILDPKADILKSFKETDRTFTAKVNPRARAKLKPYGRNILIGTEFYNSRRLYDSLMILHTKKPITFTQNENGILIMKDIDETRILVAPLDKVEMDADQIVKVLPINKFIGTERLWKKSDVIKILEETLKLSREKLIKLAEGFQADAEEKDHYPTPEDKERYVNGELGHRGHTSSYLSLKEKLAKLNGQKVDHAELFKPYYDNKGIWKDGELLI